MTRPARGRGGAEYIRPRPRPFREQCPLFLDWDTGRGADTFDPVTGAWRGQQVDPVLGGTRKKPNLADLLDTARHHRAAMLRLCGNVPRGGRWLQPGGDGRPPAAGWSEAKDKPGDGHRHAEPFSGHFRHDATGFVVRVRLASEWFPDNPAPIRPDHAAVAWRTLTEVVQEAIGQPWGLAWTPAETGKNIWKLACQNGAYDMAPMDQATGDAILRESPQHRIELFTEAGRCDCGDCLPLVAGPQIDGLAYADGRFMYYGVADQNDVAVAPATRLGREAATAQVFGPEPPCGTVTTRNGPRPCCPRGGLYHPARYLVEFTVPDMWDGFPGILPVKNGAGGWHWPNRPGAAARTWCDAAELRIALKWGWAVEVLEGIRFAKGNALRPFANRVGRALEICDHRLSLFDGRNVGGKAITPARHAVVTGAVKQMFRTAIGSFARSNTMTSFAAAADEVPANAVRVEPAPFGGFNYQVELPMDAGQREAWHPEIALWVWAQGRARALMGPPDDRGALEAGTGELVAIEGDAILTTAPQAWTRPAAEGGADDGKPGRIRLKGFAPGPFPAPATRADLRRLVRAAEQAGLGEAP